MGVTPAAIDTFVSRTVLSASQIYCFRPCKFVFRFSSACDLVALLSGAPDCVYEQLIDNFNIVENYIQEVRIGKELLCSYLESIGMNYIDTKANFVHLDLGNNMQRILNLFNNKKILVRGGLPIEGYENFLRISIGPKHEMKKVINILNSTHCK